MIPIFMPATGGYRADRAREISQMAPMSEREVQKLLDAADAGDADAQCELGYLYSEQAAEKLALLRENIPSGSRWMRGASALVETASFEQYVAEERQCAFAWFKRAAEQGHLEAIYSLSGCYERGEGTASYPEKAQALLLEAAEKGLPAAQGDVGVQFYFGRKNPVNGTVEVEQDFKKAVEWLTKAAEKDDATAQYFLAMCYENGEGVPADLAKARLWYERAAELGSINATEALDRLDEE